MRRLVLGVMWLFGLVSGCGSAATTSANPPTCQTFDAFDYDAVQGCSRGTTTPTGVQICFDASQAPSHGIAIVCLVGPDGRFYRTNLSAIATIEGTGWTHSAYGGVASTLAAGNEASCAKVLAASPLMIPSCP